MHSEICPVCQGKGKIDGQACHGCNGRGWVEVQDSTYPPFIPCTPPAPVYPWPTYPPNHDPYYPNWTCKEQTNFPQWTFTYHFEL